MHYGAKSQIFDNARKLRENMTEPEKVVWELLRKRPLGLKFRRQHPVHIYILDFYCHEKRLSIEVDGGYHIDNEQVAKDLERTSFINQIGIKEIRFSNDQVLNHFEKVELEIKKILQ
ncbi:endonuclease domain-containing protein [Cryomorpha ignava]|uniref:Endonuclease domain-containing protein n=2 Tax=Cryomorpha ignava TaxID=101383 RepID=A0A7K3WSC8_9FLAO|nr:endonuclease domain-containing protein [Cryomorpha ignava]